MSTHSKGVLVRRALKYERWAEAIRYAYGIHWKISDRLFEFGRPGAVVAVLDSASDGIRRVLNGLVKSRSVDWATRSILLGAVTSTGHQTVPQPKRTKRGSRSKNAALLAAKRRCELCGYAGPASLQVHHKIPISMGGGDGVDNLVVLCPTHHAEAHSELRKIKRAAG
jgi:5-methylcytosine-specific restriction endonuclease McrA